MPDKKKEPTKPKIKGVKVTISNDQRQIKSEQVELDVDDMIIIMPKYKSITFKKRLTGLQQSFTVTGIKLWRATLAYVTRRCAALVKIQLLR